MAKKVGVLFSGGLDSTYLVWKNLKDGNKVQPIYIEITNNKVKSIIEKNRIELLFKKFQENFNKEDLEIGGTRPIEPIEYVAQVGVCANEDSLYFKQVPVWMLGLMFCQSMGLDELQIGYVGNDDAISYLDDIRKIYKSYKVIHDNLTPLVFPLAKKRKYDLAGDLPMEYRDLIFSCEGAEIIGSEDADFVEYEPCCTCTPCKTTISTDYYGLGLPKKYREKLTELRIRQLRNQGYKITDSDGNEAGCFDVDLCRKEPYQLEIEFPHEFDFVSPGIPYIERDSTDLYEKAEAVKEEY